jgi:GPH family glycoside/pentoside/hexuronide:cation symporter
VVSVIFVIARVWDAVNDPMFGVIVDKSNPKKGKYKSWMGFAAVGLPIVVILLFSMPEIGTIGKIIWAAVFYLLFGMLYTISDVPAFSLTTAMTNNINERNTLLSVSRISPIIAGLLVSTTIIALTETVGWAMGALVIAGIGFILMNFMRFNVKERHVAPATNVSVRKIITYVLGNKYLLIYYAGYTLYATCSTGIFMLSYYAIYNLGNPNYIAILSIINTIPMVFAAFLASPICKKFGKYAVTMAVCILMVIISVIYFFVGYDNLTMVFVFSALISFLTGFMAVMYPMFTADCIEYGTWKSGERGTALSFSIQTFTTKLGQAMASGLVGVVLTVVGYTANVQQTDFALNGIFMMMTLIPALGALLMLVIFGPFYKLRESDVAYYIAENAKNEIRTERVRADY